MDVAIFLIKAEVLARLFLTRTLDCLDTFGQHLKDSINITAHLHGGNAKLVLFIDPDEESFGSIVEDTMTLRSVSLHSSNSNKQEVIIKKLLADSLIHSNKRIALYHLLGPC